MHLWLDPLLPQIQAVTTVNVPQVLLEFPTGPHIPFDSALGKIFRLLLDGVVRQVGESVRIVQRKVGDTETEVGIIVEPHSDAFSICHQHPLPNVEFLPMNGQWALHVLLQDKVTTL